jgi:hypothetical protein
LNKRDIPSFLVGYPKIFNSGRVIVGLILYNKVIINRFPTWKPWGTPNGSTAIKELVKSSGEQKRSYL